MSKSEWAILSLGFLLGLGAALMAAIPSVPTSACVWFADCFLKAQTFLAGVLAIGAASIAYLAATHREDREDSRRLHEAAESRRVLAIGLAAAFGAAARDFRRHANKARNVAKYHEKNDLYLRFGDAPATFGIALPPLLFDSERQVGLLGPETARTVLQGLQSLRSSIGVVAESISVGGPDVFVPFELLKTWADSWEESEEICSRVANELLAHADQIAAEY